MNGNGMDRHEFDLISFLFGLLFAGLGAAWLITEEAFAADLTEWFWPIVLVVGGGVVLASAMSRRDGGDSGEDLPPNGYGGDTGLPY